jgi:oligoribonuclease NrnB/cAMP/cGMP phosphodiesterase (DHH superfamily)
MSTIVIYHANCSDGFCAAWIFSKAYPDATFISAQYGDTLPPIDLKDDVFILDFSYPREVMIELQTRCKSLHVLDHHKTSQKDCEGLSFCIFNMEKSGAMLAFDYCITNKKIGYIHGMIQLVKLVQDRDLWTFRIPYSKELNIAIRSYPMTFKIWDELCNRIANNLSNYLIAEGKAIQRYRDNIVDSHIKHATEVIIAGYKIAGCYCSIGEIISEVAGELAKNKLFGCCWFDLSNVRRVYSLRSDENGLDVSAIAKSYGGGGHVHSAGFTTAISIVLGSNSH